MKSRGHHGVQVVEPLNSHNQAVKPGWDRRVGGVAELAAALHDSGLEGRFRLPNAGGRIDGAAETVDRLDPQALVLKPLRHRRDLRVCGTETVRELRRREPAMVVLR